MKAGGGRDERSGDVLLRYAEETADETGYMLGL
jgi:hypothetical protein